MTELTSKYPIGLFKPCIGVESNDWLIYNPLSYLLLDNLRPQKIAFYELETLEPAFTFCQYIKELRLECKSYVYLTQNAYNKLSEQIVNYIALYNDISTIEIIKDDLQFDFNEIDLLFLSEGINDTNCKDTTINLGKKFCNNGSLLLWGNVEKSILASTFLNNIDIKSINSQEFNFEKKLKLCAFDDNALSADFFKLCNSSKEIEEYCYLTGSELKAFENNRQLIRQNLNADFEKDQNSYIEQEKERKDWQMGKIFQFSIFKLNQIIAKLKSKNYWQIKLKKKNPSCKIKYKYAEPNIILLKNSVAKLSFYPKFSIITPTYNSDITYLKKAIQSVQHQIYPNWELVISDDGSTSTETLAYLSQLKENNIIVVNNPTNIGIAKSSNVAIDNASGDYVIFLDHDDELTIDALAELAIAINDSKADFIYSDEDKINKKNKFCDPNFKPNFSLEMLLSQNYICHLACIKKTLLDKVGKFREGYDGAQDHDLFLRASTNSEIVFHIPKVLYHWRIIPNSTASDPRAKLYAFDAGVKAIDNYCIENNIKAKVTIGESLGSYRVNREIIGNPLVSIIIPFKDEPEMLDRCLKSIFEKSTYQNFEVLAISNNSINSKAKEIILHYQSKFQNIKYLEYNYTFNYSAINNFAFSFSKGEHVILLNNDIEIINNDWIESLLQFSQLPNVGAVGAKLLYPNNAVQHAGVIIGLGGIAGHAHRLTKRDDTGYLGRLIINQNFSAVTAACLMIKRSIYQEMNGLDEINFKVAFNDVDFCLRIIEAGYQNIFTPYCLAYHHESLSRGHDNTTIKKSRFQVECDRFAKKHKRILAHGDPFYNPNLSLIFDDFSVK